MRKKTTGIKTFDSRLSEYRFTSSGIAEIKSNSVGDITWNSTKPWQKRAGDLENNEKWFFKWSINGGKDRFTLTPHLPTSGGLELKDFARGIAMFGLEEIMWLQGEIDTSWSNEIDRLTCNAPPYAVEHLEMLVGLRPGFDEYIKDKKGNSHR
jgi:hypothetical protein